MTCPRHHPVTNAERLLALHTMGRFLRLARRYPWLVSQVMWGADPVKEITESYAVVWGALQWARDRGVSRSDRSIRVLSVGDGATARTGGLLGAHTGWQIVAVDPVGRPGAVSRVEIVRGGVEAITERFPLVLATHSHAPIEATRARVLPGGTIVSLPCCVAWPEAPCQHRVVVANCLSPDRTLVIERVLPGEAP